jgi:hypothetical protein
MADLLGIAEHEVLASLREPACPLCFLISESERSLIDTFWREPSDNPAVYTSFVGAGGLCGRHAWQLERAAEAEGAGAAAATYYEQLVDHDLQWLGERIGQLAKGPNQQRDGGLLGCSGQCFVCVQLADATERHAFFLLLALVRDPDAEKDYRQSTGLCFPHLALTVERAVAEDELPIAGFLIEDWRARLKALRKELSEYQRKRNHIFAHERKDSDECPWIEVVRRYAGEAPGREER